MGLIGDERESVLTLSHSHIIKQWYIGRSANDVVPSEDRTLQI